MGIFDHNPGNKPTPQPPPPTFDTYLNVSPGSGVTGALYIDDGTIITAVGQQHVTFLGIPSKLNTWGGYIRLSAPGFKESNLRVSVVSPSLIPGSLTLEPATPPFPAPPSRTDKITSSLHFGGLYFNHSLYGRLPLFDACFAWLNEVDRQSLYAAKRAAGDRHLLVAVPDGKVLYDEGDQPYSPDRFGILNYGPWFLDVVAEAIQEGFIPVLFMDELPDPSLAMIQQVLKDCLSYKVNLVPYCIFSPGWDGVFYGWTDPNGVPNWAKVARSIAPDATLFLEHDPGHIPLGEGGGDYKPGGDMQDFDIIAGEYPVIADDTLWQVCARMACGPNGYHRPSDQPAGDDPNPPQYLPSDSPRGPFAYWVFERGVYEFVRDRITPEAMDANRAYCRAFGALNVC